MTVAGTAELEVLLGDLRPTMFGTAVRITRSHADADDVCQNASVKAWHQLPSYRGESGLSAWVLAITRNEALSLIRSRTRLPVVALDDGWEVGTSDTPESAGDRHEFWYAVGRGVQTMTHDVAAAWSARDLDGHSYSAIAEQQGVTVSTVRGRIARGRHRLAYELRDWA